VVACVGWVLVSTEATRLGKDESNEVITALHHVGAIKSNEKKTCHQHYDRVAIDNWILPLRLLKLDNGWQAGQKEAETSIKKKGNSPSSSQGRSGR
jgi:hypothetical protein